MLEGNCLDKCHLHTARKFLTVELCSNGLLDPWSSGGLLKAPGGKGVLAVIIPEGAHHLDLRAADPADPVSVQEARKQERAMIGMWVQKSKPQGGLKP